MFTSQKCRGGAASVKIWYAKTKSSHWNLLGTISGDVHESFNRHEDSLNKAINTVAERTRTLGGPVFETLLEFSSVSQFQEPPRQRLGARAMIESLLKDHESMKPVFNDGLDICKAECPDVVTARLLIDLLQLHELIAADLKTSLDRLADGPGAGA